MGEVHKLSEAQEALIQRGKKLQQGLAHYDAWKNVMTGLGTSVDKAMHTKFRKRGRIPDQELSDLFHGDDIARRVVSIRPREMLRKGFFVKTDEDAEDDADAIDTELTRLKVSEKFKEGLTWGLLYGGAAAIVGVNDGREADQPVDEDSIQSIDFLNVIDKRYLTPVEYQTDPMQADFGEPTVYMVTPQTAQGVTPEGSTRVHASRMIVFPGVLTSDDVKSNNDSWDLSMLQTILPVIRDFQSNWLAVGNLIQEASVGVYKVKDLINLIASGQQNTLTQRLQMIDISKSVARSIAIDADAEDYNRIGAQLNELSSLLDRYMLRLSSAVEIPVTILMGQSPAGMNATGDADFRWFYDNIETDQTNILKPLLYDFLRLLFLSSEGPTGGVMPEAFDVIFSPLWASTPKEQAEIEKLTAEKDGIYIDKKVLLPEEVGLSRYTVQGFRQDTTINRKIREQSLEKKIELKEQAIENPPPAPPQGQPPMQPGQQPPQVSAAATPTEEGPETTGAAAAPSNVPQEGDQ